MVILQAIQDFGNWFWGIPILILIGGGGLFLTIYLGFPQIRHFGYAMSQTFGKMFAKKEEGKVRPISAAFAALACAVGASNIVGVPVAIALGGPGAVFWIWILAIFGMCTKYCEVAMGSSTVVRTTWASGSVAPPTTCAVWARRSASCSASATPSSS